MPPLGLQHFASLPDLKRLPLRASPTGGGGVVAALVNAVLPIISGLAVQGQTLSCSTGSWTGIPASYAYQWKRGGSAISGATAAAYTPVSGDVGSVLTCTVTATNTFGSVAATSAATATIAAILAISGTPGAATVGTAYSFTPTTTGGSGTKALSLTGSLPSGFSFSSSTGAITAANPTTAGTTTGLNITVTDASGSASLGAFSLAVSATATIAAPIITWSSDVYATKAVANSMLLDSNTVAGDVLTRKFALDSAPTSVIASQAHTILSGDLTAGAQPGGSTFSWPALGSPLPTGSLLDMWVEQTHGGQVYISNVETKTLSSPPELEAGFPNVSPAFAVISGTGTSMISGSNLILAPASYGALAQDITGLNTGDIYTIGFTVNSITNQVNFSNYEDGAYGANIISTLTVPGTYSYDITISNSKIAPMFGAGGGYDHASLTLSAMSLKKKV